MELRRGVDPALLARLSGVSYPILFAYLDWPGAPVWAHSGVGPITWGGQTWQGVGHVGAVELPEESAEIAATEAMLTLAGVAADLDGYADDNIRNRLVEIYLGSVQGRPGGHDGRQVTGPGSTLAGAPQRLFAGLMDVLTLTAAKSDEGVEHTAQVSVISGQEARSAATVFHSDEDQKRKFPGDTAGRLVILAFARAQKLTWPEN